MSPVLLVALCYLAWCAACWGGAICDTRRETRRLLDESRRELEAARVKRLRAERELQRFEDSR